MTVYVDTSALIAVVDAADQAHARADRQWYELLDADDELLTSSYVLLETTALLQRRLGVDAVHALHERIRPVLDVVWVEQDLHDSATHALLAADRRQVSLVDRVGFVIMGRAGVDVAFTFDRDFVTEGFTVVP